MKGEHRQLATVLLNPREERPLRGLSHNLLQLPQQPSVLELRGLWRYHDRLMNTRVLGGIGMSNTFWTTSSSWKFPHSLPTRELKL